MSAVEKSNWLADAAGDVGGGVGVDAGASNEKPLPSGADGVLAGVSNEKPLNGASLGVGGAGAGADGASNEKPGGGVTGFTGPVSVEKGDFGGGAGAGVGEKKSSA